MIKNHKTKTGKNGKQIYDILRCSTSDRSGVISANCKGADVRFAFRFCADYSSELTRSYRACYGALNSSVPPLPCLGRFLLETRFSIFRFSIFGFLMPRCSHRIDEPKSNTKFSFIRLEASRVMTCVGKLVVVYIAQKIPPRSILFFTNRVDEICLGDGWADSFRNHVL